MGPAFKTGSFSWAGRRAGCRQRTHNPPPKGHRRFESDPAHHSVKKGFRVFGTLFVWHKAELSNVVMRQVRCAINLSLSELGSRCVKRVRSGLANSKALHIHPARANGSINRPPLSDQYRHSSPVCVAKNSCDLITCPRIFSRSTWRSAVQTGPRSIDNLAVSRSELRSWEWHVVCVRPASTPFQ